MESGLVYFQKPPLKMHSMFPPGSDNLSGHLKAVELGGKRTQPHWSLRQPHAGCLEHHLASFHTGPPLTHSDSNPPFLSFHQFPFFKSGTLTVEAHLKSDREGPCFYLAPSYSPFVSSIKMSSPPPGSLPWTFQVVNNSFSGLHHCHQHVLIVTLFPLIFEFTSVSSIKTRSLESTSATLFVFPMLFDTFPVFAEFPISWFHTSSRWKAETRFLSFPCQSDVRSMKQGLPHGSHSGKGGCGHPTLRDSGGRESSSNVLLSMPSTGAHAPIGAKGLPRGQCVAQTGCFASKPGLPLLQLL